MDERVKGRKQNRTLKLLQNCWIIKKLTKNQILKTSKGHGMKEVGYAARTVTYLHI